MLGLPDTLSLSFEQRTRYEYLDEQFPFLDVLAGVEIDLANDARHLGRDHDAARGRDGADRLQRRLPTLARNEPGRDDRGGPAAVAGGLLLHLQVLPAEYATEYEREKYEYYCQSFYQGKVAGLSDGLLAQRADYCN